MPRKTGSQRKAASRREPSSSYTTSSSSRRGGSNASRDRSASTGATARQKTVK